MTITRRGSRRTAAASAGVVLAVMAGSLTPTAQAEVTKDRDCPTPVPMSAVTSGLIGEGLTVVKGAKPEAFKVEVLGVLNDGIGAGRDMIIIRATDYAGKHVVDQGGGIWAGMSGSPVYVGNKLLGAVSYGFTAAPSELGGLTPARDMYDVLDYTTKPNKLNAARVQAATTVSMSSAKKADLAAKAGVATPRGSMAQLPTPLGISGVGARRVEAFQQAADKAGLAVKAYAAGGHSAAKASSTPESRPEPGGNFAAALTYGDVTLAGIGTTTAVCGNQALAFGHPLNRQGPVQYGANNADAITIIKDNTFGSFKMANLGKSFGTVDQDRTTAIRGDLTKNPTYADVTTIMRNGDNGKKRTGTTKVVDQNFLSAALVEAIWGNYDATFDEWGDGVATSNWTITGTRGNGAPFSLSRSNQWADRTDVTVPPAFDVAGAADALINNDFEKVTIKTVTFGSTAKTAFDQLHITKVAVSVNGKAYTTPKRLKLKVGDKLKVRVGVAPYRSTATKYSYLPLTVPKSAKGRSGVLSATGGTDAAEFGGDASLECLLVGDCSGNDGPTSFNGLLNSIAATPRNDAVIADLSLESNDSYGSVASASKLKTRTVTGYKEIEVSVGR